jgi:hypothetical protein
MARVLWYTIALYAGLAYVAERVLPLIGGPIYRTAGLLLAREVVGLIVLLLLFAVADLGLSRAIRVLRDQHPPGGVVEAGFAFPAGVTVVVGSWLGLFALLAIAGLLLPLSVDKLSENMTGALVAMAAAGIGSAVATIVGYLKHASEQKDFDLAYVPWYFARPLMGLLLGLIFFLLLKAGLLATYPGVATENAAVNEWGIAGISALVGLFSKPAIEKLREVFNVLFRTEAERDEDLLGRLPEDERERIRPFLRSPSPAEKSRR